MLLTSSDTKRTLRHLFLLTNSAQRELVSICTQILQLTFLAFLQNVVHLLCAFNITGDMKNLFRFQHLWFYLTKLKSERDS